MEKDLIDYIRTPTKKEYRKDSVIDEIYGMPRLNIPKNTLLFKLDNHLIDSAIVNYNNEVLMTKIYYANMVKYQKYYQKNNDYNYDFLARKNGELLIREFYSIYDKSMHILNYLMKLKVSPGTGFNQNVLKRIRKHDEKFYKELKDIYDELFNKNNILRNDITHNFSNLFFRYKEMDSDDGKGTVWYAEDPIGYDEYKEKIDKISKLLAKNKQLIMKKIQERFPRKGTSEYDKKMSDKKEFIDKLFNN